MNRRILCVDDEPRILEALERTLGERFEVSTAESGADGLQLLTADGPFAVVVSDMRMPQMDGAVFLSRVQDVAPDTTRVLLTGQADIQSAIDAVNRGGIFRFLCKPCPIDVLERALEAAVEQHRLRLLERELLEQTLAGTLKMLADILALVAPSLFAQANRLRDCVMHLTKKLRLGEPWQYEVAAMLSQIGLVSLPPDVIERAVAGKTLTEEERRLIQEHPAVGHRLVMQIPRLEKVAAMIRDQRSPQPTEIAPVVIGAGMLRIAGELDIMLGRGVSYAEALAGLVQRGCDPQLIAALKDYRPPEAQTWLRALAVAELKPGMVLDDEVRSRSGNVMVAKGQVVTTVLLERIRRIAQTIGIVEPIHVRSA